MEITFVTKDTLNKVWQDRILEFNKKGLVCFGFNGLGLVSFKKELSGETEYFSDLAKFSKQISSVVICGCNTDNYGIFRHSAVIAENGKILGVTDMINVPCDSEYDCGVYLKVYQTSIGRIGIIVAEDLYFAECVKSLVLCEADIIVCVFEKVENAILQVVLRAQAFMYGINMALVSNNFSAISNGRGEMELSSTLDIVNRKIKPQKNYSQIKYKKSGLFR